MGSLLVLAMVACTHNGSSHEVDGDIRDDSHDGDIRDGDDRDGDVRDGDDTFDSTIEPGCGNGRVEPVLNEECEAGGSGSSVSDQYDCVECRWVGGYCGDGLVQPDAGEECDDGADTIDDDGCDLSCRRPRVVLPSCEVNRPGVKHIASDADFDAVNDPSYHVFCVHPGIYGIHELALGGTTAERRYLLAYDPDQTGEDVKPWNQAPGQRANIAQLNINSPYWTLYGLTFDQGDDEYGLLNLEPGSHHVIIDSILAQDGRAMIRFEEGEYHTLQNSVLRRPRRTPGRDRTCVVTFRAKRMRIINNEIYNCTDGIQVWGPENDEGEYPRELYSPEGTLISHNEIYITPEIYADCENLDPHESLTPDGNCACAENAIDMKTGVQLDPSEVTADEFIRVSHNVFYGFRHTHPTCGGSGDGGNALNLHRQESDFIIIEGNIIFNAQRGIWFQHSPDHNTIRNNLLWAIGAYDPQVDGTALYLRRGSRVEVYHNTVVGTADAQYFLRHDEEDAVSDYDIRNNLFVLAGGHTPAVDLFPASTIIEHNGFVEMTALTVSGDAATNVVVPSLAEAALADYCFTIQKHTAPTTFCIPHAVPTAASPLVDAGDSQVGARPGIGVDDSIGVFTDLAGNSRDDAPDLGAFELGRSAL